MSWGDAAVSQQKYYDAAEVEEYIEKVTATITRLQDNLRVQTWRADQAEQQSRATPVEPPDMSHAYLNQAVADAEARAAHILADAQRRADRLVEAATAERDRLLESARRTAWERAHDREVRLLAAVNAFVQRSHQLGDDLQVIETEATEWRLELATSTAVSRAAPAAPQGNGGAVPAANDSNAPAWTTTGVNTPPPPPLGGNDLSDERWQAPASSIPSWPRPPQESLG
jgi:cell division septum initiation protein DivIVA